MSFVVHSRHSTSLQIASLDCELLTRGDSRRVTRERFPAPNPPCSYDPSYIAQLPRIDIMSGKPRRIRYHAVLQRISDLGCLPITCAYRYCALVQPFSI